MYTRLSENQQATAASTFIISTQNLKNRNGYNTKQNKILTNFLTLFIESKEKKLEPGFYQLDGELFKLEEPLQKAGNGCVIHGEKPQGVYCGFTRKGLKTYEIEIQNFDSSDKETYQNLALLIQKNTTSETINSPIILLENGLSFVEGNVFLQHPQVSQYMNNLFIIEDPNPSTWIKSPEKNIFNFGSLGTIEQKDVAQILEKKLKKNLLYGKLNATLHSIETKNNNINNSTKILLPTAYKYINDQDSYYDTSADNLFIETLNSFMRDKPVNTVMQKNGIFSSDNKVYIQCPDVVKTIRIQGDQVEDAYFTNTNKTNIADIPKKYRRYDNRTVLLDHKESYLENISSFCTFLFTQFKTTNDLESGVFIQGKSIDASRKGHAEVPVTFPAIKKIGPQKYLMERDEHHPYEVIIQLNDNGNLFSMTIDQEPVAIINPRALNEADNNLLIHTMNTHLINSNVFKLGANTLYTNSDTKPKFVLLTDPILKVPKPSINPNLKIYDFYIPALEKEGLRKHKPKELGAGSFGKVKAVSAYYTINNNKFVELTDQMDMVYKKISDTEKIVKKEGELTKLIYPETKEVIYREDKKTGLIFMPKLLGENLQDVIEKLKEHTFEEKLEVLKSLAEALADFHKKGLVHGDLKPANIRYDKNKNKFYILDFGGSKKVNELDRFYFGTYAYEAPEMTEVFHRSRGEKKNLREKGENINEQISDVYSLFGIFDQILGGKAVKKRPRGLLFNINHSCLPTLLTGQYSKKEKESRKALHDVMRKMLAIPKEDRPYSDDLAAKLSAIQQHMDKDYDPTKKKIFNKIQSKIDSLSKEQHQLEKKIRENNNSKNIADLQKELSYVQAKRRILYELKTDINKDVNQNKSLNKIIQDWESSTGSTKIATNFGLRKVHNKEIMDLSRGTATTLFGFRTGTRSLIDNLLNEFGGWRPASEVKLSKSKI